MQIMEDMLRHRHDGLTIAEIATATGSSTGTVSHILERALCAGPSAPRTVLNRTWPKQQARPCALTKCGFQTPPG